MEPRQIIVLWLVFLTSLTSPSYESVETGEHRAAFDEIARINEAYAKYQHGRTWQIDMKIPRGYVGVKGMDGLAPIRDRTSLWPRGVIPYSIAYSMPENSKVRQLLKDAMEEWEKHTCIKFEKRASQSDYVEFYYGEGCNSDVGRAGGRQTTSLGRGCAHHGIVLHELGHIIGFWHEQNRPDRDKFISIREHNIIPKFKFAFEKYSNKKIDSLGVQYDYHSVMHYGAKAFSRNGQATLVAKDTAIKSFGNTHLSVLDIKQANLLYNCPDYPDFPEDFVWNSYGSMNRSAECLRIFQPYSTSWLNNFLCYRKDKKNLHLRWSFRGPLKHRKCINIKVPTKQSRERWDQAYFCWPRDGIYKFEWLTHAPSNDKRDKCLKWTEPLDPTWNNSRYFLCATKDQKPIDGNWTNWAPWSDCNRKCGGGVQTRSRSCTNPQPAFGGAYCAGKSLERRPCNSEECTEWPSFPTDFTFSMKDRPGPDEICLRIFERRDYITWRKYFFCTPGYKRQLEMRWSDATALKHMQCTRIYVPDDSYGRKRGRWDNNYLCLPLDSGFPYRFVWSYHGQLPGLPCLRWFAKGGKDGWDKTYLCATNSTIPAGIVKPVHGNWSSWSQWSPCGRTCGGGSQHRVRLCNNPSPRSGGRRCVGKDLDEKKCNQNKCPLSCGGVLEADGGVVQSPNYPSRYPNGVDCDWLIQVPRGKVVRLVFSFFDIEGYSPCSFDFLAVYDGQTQSSRRLGRFCGQRRPPELQSSSNHLLLKFHTDPRRSHMGFRARWNSINEQEIVTENIAGCGGQINKLSGTLISPGFPRRYPPNADCVWVISVPKEYYLELKFVSFDIHKVGRGCSYDYVEVRDGNARHSPSLGRHCGPTKPADTFQSMSNHVRIRLHTDNSGERRGFQLKWNSVLRITLPTTAPLTRAYCPRGWVSHVDDDSDIVYCYLVRSRTHTWYKARKECLHFDSDLLSITNEKEQEFVTKHLLAESFMWIGFNDLEREGAWAWSDRTREIYQNWANGDPNNGGTYRRNEEDCAVLKSDGKWNDYPCTRQFKYICKARANTSNMFAAGVKTSHSAGN